MGFKGDKGTFTGGANKQKHVKKSSALRAERDPTISFLRRQ